MDNNYQALPTTPVGFAGTLIGQAAADAKSQQQPTSNVPQDTWFTRLLEDPSNKTFLYIGILLAMAWIISRRYV